MLIRLLLFLCAISPTVRRAAWRWWYGKLARNIPTENWTFMNYGYVPGQNEPPPQLQSADELDRFCIQLYHRVISPARLAGAEVLEVGCGRGGGASYMARYHQPKRVTGVDYSADAINFCRLRHDGIANLQFVTGDSENLPFTNETFDVVVNVESSHCYGNVTRFFSEAARVLRPKGLFVFADLRGAEEMEELRTSLAAEQRWKKLEEEDITERVAAALHADDARKRKMITEAVPAEFRETFKEFAGVEGGKVFRGLQNRDLVYFRFAFERL